MWSLCICLFGSIKILVMCERVEISVTFPGKRKGFDYIDLKLTAVTSLRLLRKPYLPETKNPFLSAFVPSIWLCSADKKKKKRIFR